MPIDRMFLQHFMPYTHSLFTLQVPMLNETERIVLLVAADAAKLRSVVVQLSAACYSTRTVGSASAACQAVIQLMPFAIVIDGTGSYDDWAWRLSHDLAVSIRAYVVLLISPGSLDAQDRGMAIGADLCLAVTDGYARHLVAYLDRQQARLRHSSTEAKVKEESTLQLDMAHRRVIRNGCSVALSRTECGILELLSCRPDQVVALSEICHALWSDKDYHASLGLLKQYVGRLRRKIEPDPHRPIHLETVRTVGYCFHPQGRIHLSVVTAPERSASAQATISAAAPLAVQPIPGDRRNASSF